MSAQVETKRAKRQAAGPYGKVGQILNELDDRLGVAKGGRTFLDKIFPDHWSFMLGEIALYSFVVLLLTGIFLTLYYIPSSAITTYHGSYLPLVGQKMSEAYASSVNLSFAVRGGLLMRQMHHWACDIFVGSIIVHMGRVFFTGAFRKPRELNWTIGTTLLVLAIAEGFLGYSLPDDLVSGTGIRIAYSIILSLPVVGTYIAFFLFGGNFPGAAIIPRFFIIHVLIIPLVLLGPTRPAQLVQFRLQPLQRRVNRIHVTGDRKGANDHKYNQAAQAGDRAFELPFLQVNRARVFVLLFFVVHGQ